MWGPASVSSIEGYKYYLVMVDEFTRYSWIYPLKMKYDVKVIFSQFLSLIETQVGTRVKVVHCDNGGEFTALKGLLYDLGIVMRLS